MNEHDKPRRSLSEPPTEAPPRHGAGPWLTCAIIVSGLAPSVVLLLIYGAVSFEGIWNQTFKQIWPYFSLLPNVGFDSTKYKFPMFLLFTICFPVATPLYLILWSYFLNKVSMGPRSATPLKHRLLQGTAAMATMILANFAIGGIALIATIALYIWRSGIPIPIVR